MIKCKQCGAYCHKKEHLSLFFDIRQVAFGYFCSKSCWDAYLKEHSRNLLINNNQRKTSGKYEYSWNAIKSKDLLNLINAFTFDDNVEALAEELYWLYNVYPYVHSRFPFMFYDKKLYKALYDKTNEGLEKFNAIVETTNMGGEYRTMLTKRIARFSSFPRRAMRNSAMVAFALVTTAVCLFSLPFL
jgi:hypothetical protein